MNTPMFRSFSFLLISVCAGTPAMAEEGSMILWTIGTADNNTQEFLLAPGDYGAYREPGLYCVGLSDPARDWPYVHPGPADGWAGGKPHTFTIVFFLAAAPEAGSCRLVLDLADTHGQQPPMVNITVNGKSHDRRTSPGSGSDASVSGNPEAGKKSRINPSFPASLLQTGENTFAITTTSGSWMLYDAVHMEAPADARLLETPPPSLYIGQPAAPPLLREHAGTIWQVLQIPVRYFGEPCDVRIDVAGAPPQTVALTKQMQMIEGFAPEVVQPTDLPVTVTANGRTVTETARLHPVRKFTVYIMHHTHLDIGYTHLQSDVEAMQWQHMETALELIEKTAEYPEGARFKWLPEALWAVDSYQQQASPAQRAAFLDAVRAGSIGLDALYGNQLTALCRPEELIELTGYARRLARETGVTLDTAMISDVPGYTWGLVPVLAQSGVKYLSIGPNATHRIGFTLKTWGDKPFYWVSPSGKEEVLCWVAGKAYSWFHAGKMTDGMKIVEYLKDLEASDFPYDIVHVRYSIGGDNGPPDPDLPDILRDWNARYAWPKLVMATTKDAFEVFEQRYGDQVPRVTSDFTPYWEDGAASSALETALNREAAERLVQAQALWSMLKPEAYPADAFQKAWREILLYDEHTWGAHNSITQPESDFAKGQWAVKQAFALEGDRLSRELLDQATQAVRVDTAATDTVLVFNTTSWPRTEMVTLAPEWANHGTSVSDTNGNVVPSQVLSTGELVFLAVEVPPFGGKKYKIAKGDAELPPEPARVDGDSLSNGKLTLKIDPETGAIQSARLAGMDAELVDRTRYSGLNDYLYVAGRDPESPQRNSKPRISVKEAGPLMASLLIESEAPGCRSLTREVRIVAGMDHIEIVDILDKETIYEKEAVHFAFPFNVPGGTVRMDTPFAVVRPELDQMPGACKNYFTVQRWLDVSNAEYGITWAVVDTPLVQVGGITNDPVVTGWIENLEPSTTLVAYVMNNYWETNYKAAQEGVTVFRYALRPHGGDYCPVAAQRFGVGHSQPLIAVAAAGRYAPPSPRVHITPDTVIAVVLKPGDDGASDILRLFNTADQPCEATLSWGENPPAKVEISILAETAGQPVENTVPLAPYEMVTLRLVYPPD